ncbi:MAG: tripartite tricarboxylate transporter substrate binding protein [Clostridium sp.]|nr:tripartite tricarboxylate transporter substrate binding protein [Clostridium sp.]
MKKTLAALLTAAMTAATLTGCANANSAGSAPATTAAAAETKAAEASKAADAGADATTDWPKKAVTVTLPYSAGGDTDTYCRALFQAVGEKLGQNFVITNLTGGSGLVAAKDVMSKAPDGYNIFFTHTGAALVQEAMGTADFSYTDNFTNVCTVAEDATYTLVALSPNGSYKQYSRGWNNLEDMLADAKANPGVVRYSTVFGSTTQYVGTSLEKAAGVQFDNIDVGTAAGDRLAAFLGGQVDLIAVNYMNVEDYIEKGDVIALGVFSDKPMDGVDVKTLKEQGYDCKSTKKYEVKFPAGADQAIVDKLSAACKEVAESEEFKKTLATYHAAPLYRDAETTGKEDKAEVEELKAAMAQ